MAASHVQPQQFSYWFCVFTIQSILKETSISLFSKWKKAVLVLIFCLTMLSHAQGTYTYNWNRLTIKILHCHPVVIVSKRGCSAHRQGDDSLGNAEATQQSQQQLKHQELAPCYPGKQSRISNDVISHYSSSKAVSPRHLTEDAQSIPRNIGSLKGNYSGLAVNNLWHRRPGVVSTDELEGKHQKSLRTRQGFNRQSGECLTLTYEKYSEVHL